MTRERAMKPMRYIAKFVVLEDRRSKTAHVVPNPNDMGHATRGRKCWCEPRIERFPTVDLVVHNERVKP
jgi:hypothetical protein